MNPEGERGEGGRKDSKLLSQLLIVMVGGLITVCLGHYFSVINGPGNFCVSVSDLKSPKLYLDDITGDYDEYTLWTEENKNNTRRRFVLNNAVVEVRNIHETFNEYDHKVRLTCENSSRDIKITFSVEQNVTPFESGIIIELGDSVGAGEYPMVIAGFGGDGTVCKTTFFVVVTNATRPGKRSRVQTRTSTSHI